MLPSRRRIVLAAAIPLLCWTQASAASQADPAGLLSKGSRLLDRGSHLAAIVALAAAAEPDWPCRDAALVLLSRARLAADDPRGALEAADAALAVADSVRHGEARLLRARALAALDPAAAAVAWSAVVSDADAGEAARAEALVGRAEALEAAKSPEAGAAWREVAVRAPAAGPADAWQRASRLAAADRPVEPLSRAELVGAAMTLSAANLHERAASAWQAVAAAGSAEAPRAMLERARSLYNLRRNAEARQACEEALARFPASSDAAECHLVAARVASRMGDDADVQRLARKALADARWRGASWRDDLILLRAGNLADDSRWLEAAAQYDSVAGARAPEATWKASWCRLAGGATLEAADGFRRLAAREGVDTETGRNARLWAALALDRAGGDVAREEATRLLADLHAARPWSYHGQRARQILGRRLPAERLAALDAEAADSGVAFVHPGAPALEGVHGARYAILRDAGIHALAVDELERLVARSRDTPALVFELARARARGGDSARAHSLLSRWFTDALGHPSRRSPREFWEVIYPRPFAALVEEHASRAGVDPAFACAIIRAESAWQPHVRSVADARGLMQLMPATASLVARAAGRRDFDAEQLFDPDVNVELGTRHLARVLDLFGGDEAAAAASYNAGEDKVARWWAECDERGVTDAIERIERIPYRETRNYVKRVLEAAGWYRWLEGCDPRHDDGA